MRGLRSVTSLCESGVVRPVCMFWGMFEIIFRAPSSKLAMLALALVIAAAARESGVVRPVCMFWGMFEISELPAPASQLRLRQSSTAPPL